MVVAPPVMMPMPGTGRGHLNLATSIRSLRLRSGLSQRQLAGRMSVPRTYVSKIENEKATPTLSSLERLARALEVTVPELLSGGERSRQEEVNELMKDQFIAELLPFVSQLNGMQMSSILTQVRDLTIRPRRSAEGQFQVSSFRVSSCPGTTQGLGVTRNWKHETRNSIRVYPGNQPTLGRNQKWFRLFSLSLLRGGPNLHPNSSDYLCRSVL
ncbi:MAG: helix-turn-helix transcriptional regulator [Candidatus Sulfotelmatobacter sp.]